MQLFWIPIVKIPRKTIIMHFTKRQNNFKAFVNLHIRPIILFYKQYFLQDIFVRVHFLVKITAGKVRINFTGDKGFHMLLQHSASVIRPHAIHNRLEKILSTRADPPGMWDYAG